MLEQTEELAEKDEFVNVFDWELRTVISRFKELYPNYEGLNGMTMRAILHGDKVIVNVKSTNKFQVWTRSDILAGKLDSLNAKIKAVNKRIRQIHAEKKRALEDAFDVACRGVVDTTQLVKIMEKLLV